MDASFFEQDVRIVAPALIGCELLRTFPNGQTVLHIITETEAYCGTEDSACYAHKGRNKISELLFHPGGTIFVHRCYGIHWMLNVVTGPSEEPQGVLIRGIDDIHGPGRVTKALKLTDAYNDMNISSCKALSIRKGSSVISYRATPRIGISYAEKTDQERLWRFVADMGAENESIPKHTSTPRNR